MNKYELQLEFDKIINLAKKFAKSSYASDLFDDLEEYYKVSALKEELETVLEAKLAITKLKSIEISNIEGVLQTLGRLKLEAFLNVDDFHNLFNLLKSINYINQYYRDIKALNIKLEHLDPYFQNIKQNRNLELDISLVFDDDFNMKDNASLKLQDIRKRIKLQEQALRAKMNDILRSSSKMLSDNVIVYKDSKMCLPYKQEFKNSVKGVFHGTSQSGETVYIEPLECLEISNRIMEFNQKEKEEIERILMNLSVKSWSHYESLRLAFDNIVRLDFVFAKALYANSIEANMPIINNGYKINFKNAYHPLIYRDKCVPININLGIDFDTIIITGPNTGGKTVSLKTVGLLSIMLKYGFLIPVDESSEASIFNNIYASIETSQSIEQSLSTFSANMKEVISIIDDVKPNSLVLFDELGSGTDPKEGSNLAIAVIEYLMKKKAKIICTTHYSDLKNYAYNHDRITNASVMFDINTLKPLYTLVLGVSGASNALSIASRLGLKQDIIDEASKLASESGISHEKVLEKVESLNQELVFERKRLAEKELELQEKENVINQKEAELVHKLLNYEDRAKAKAEKIINEAKEEAKELIEEIKNLQNKDEVKTNELADIKNKINKLAKTEESILEFEANVGDQVLIKSFNQVGKVIRIKKDIYEVRAGNLTLNVKKDDLAPAVIKKEEKKKVLPKEMKNTRGIDEIKSYKLELDLRGYRYEEVKPALEKFIDQAYLAHVGQVYVIHGFGTGAVRKACYQYFKNSPYVKETRFGGEGEGLNGVTVVILK